jgi:MoaA/NifB/PqqE/SkfB family radical SAM enzyme
LISTEAEQLVRFLDASPQASAWPREIALELNTRRASRPIYSPSTHLKIDRPDLTMQLAGALFEEIASADDLRLVLGGVGDPLLHPRLFEMVDEAHRAGIGAIALETDLLGVEPAVIDQLADSPLDVISVNFPAALAPTYQAIMGVDGFKSAMENLARLISRRQSNGRGTPLVIPTFVKTAGNLAEMEAWYDHWVRVLGCAVISGPSDFAGEISDVSIAQMEPPRRKACARLARRLTVLCDGRIVSCEQDIMGRQSFGRIGENSIQSVWTGAMTELSRDHAAGDWQRHPLCGTCKEWHRP